MCQLLGQREGRDSRLHEGCVFTPLTHTSMMLMLAQSIQPWGYLTICDTTHKCWENADTYDYLSRQTLLHSFLIKDVALNLINSKTKTTNQNTNKWATKQKKTIKTCHSGPWQLLDIIHNRNREHSKRVYIPRVSPSRESKLSSPKLLRRRGCWCVCGGRPLTTPFRSSDTPPGTAPIPSAPSKPSRTGDWSPRCAIGGPLKNEGGKEEGWGWMGVCIRRGGLESPYCCGNWLFEWWGGKAGCGGPRWKFRALCGSLRMRRLAGKPMLDWGSGLLFCTDSGSPWGEKRDWSLPTHNTNRECEGARCFGRLKMDGPWYKVRKSRVEEYSDLLKIKQETTQDTDKWIWKQTDRWYLFFFQLRGFPLGRQQPAMLRFTINIDFPYRTTESQNIRK